MLRWQQEEVNVKVNRRPVQIIPWVLFVAVAAAALIFGNRSIQDAEHRDYAIEDAKCQQAYLENQVSQIYAEMLKLHAENDTLRRELAELRDGKS